MALNTTKPSRVKSNVDLANAVVPQAFWQRLKREGLASFAPPITLRHSVHLRLLPACRAPLRRSLSGRWAAVAAQAQGPAGICPSDISEACGRVPVEWRTTLCEYH